MTTLVGNLIKKYREEKRISQKELCEGICKISTLSRIESGMYMPNYMQMRVLITRLGKDMPVNIIPITKREKEIYDLEDLFSQITDCRDPKQIQLLEEYKKCITQRDFLANQEYLLNYGIYISQFDERLEEARKIFIKAIRLTKTDFPEDGNKIPEGLYSTVELGLLNNIAHAEYYIYDVFRINDNYKISAIEKMEFLKQFYENNVDNYKENRMYSAVLFNLTNWYGLDEKYKKAFELAQLGISVSGRRFYYFTRHIYNKGYNQIALGHLKSGKEEIKKSIELIKLTEDFGDADYLLKAAEKKFNLKL